jgi:replicative DNA helicase
MSREDLVLRLLCTQAEVSMHKLRGGYLQESKDGHRRLVDAANRLNKALIYLDDSGGLDVMELRARARRMKHKHDIRLFIIDYLQLLHYREFSRQGRQIETGAISGCLKAMAKELGVPVLVVSQLSRAPENRDGVPRLADLRDSGSIEQDADVVLLLRRPSLISGDKDVQDKRLAILEIAKNRNGPVHQGIHLDFDADLTRFSDRKEHGVDGVEPGQYDESRRSAEGDAG